MSLVRASRCRRQARRSARPRPSRRGRPDTWRRRPPRPVWRCRGLRKPCAIGADADIPGRDVGGRDRFSELRSLRQGRNRDEHRSQTTRSLRIDISRLPLLIDAPARDRMVVIDTAQTTFSGNTARVGCTIPVSSVARLCSTAGPPFHCHGVRKRTGALARIEPCRAAGAQLCPPSADTSTCRMLPLPDQASPEIS